MLDSCGRQPMYKPIRRLLRGQGLVESYACGIAVKDADNASRRPDCIQVLSCCGAESFHAGYSAYILESADSPERAIQHAMARGIPCVANVATDDISSGDIIEVNNPVGRVRILHSIDSDDNSVVLTNRCNCNCLMCPDSENTRRHGHDVPLEWITRYLSLVDPNTRHLTITGGEPTLLKDGLFALLDLCREILPATQFLLLTNGRMLYYADYARALAKHSPRRMVVATALHSAVAEEHDRITGVAGSFAQTTQGIRNLLSCGMGVEVRVVLQKANYRNLYDLSMFVAREVPGVLRVSFMGLELLGNAARNLDAVWIDHREAMGELIRAINCLLQHGITPRIYNLPLCLVDSHYWSLCAQSIADYKRTFKSECANCAVQDHCGGLFGTKANHRLTQVRPIERSISL